MASDALKQVAKQIENGIKFPKCHKCGCQQGTVKAIEGQLSSLAPDDQELLKPLLERSKATFVPTEYDCLGCKVCFPSVATNALQEAYPTILLEADGCSTDAVAAPRDGWPIFPGNYEVFRYQAPVAVCTLNSKELIRDLAASRAASVAVVGSLNTENLGIERIIKNTISNPNIRYLILCGEDSEQKIGHLPGQSLVSLFQNGIDETKRIIGAKGRRPVLKNIEATSVAHFREQVELVSMIGCTIPANVVRMADYCAKKGKGPFSGSYPMEISVPRIEAKPPKRLVLDPRGYFVVFPDPARRRIVLEHYHLSGVLSQIIEGTDIGSIYMTAIDLGLLSKLDHGCYLGKELTRAEESLRTGKPYVQDMAQDAPEDESTKAVAGAGCKPGCC